MWIFLSSQSLGFGKKLNLKSDCLAVKASYNRHYYHGVAILIFTPFQLIVTKLRLDKITVWYHVCVTNAIVIDNREHDQDGDRSISLFEVWRT